MPWPLPVEPYPDELLSSFLVRAAYRHGLSPYRFCAFHFPGSAIWNRDIDRSAPDALLETVAEQARLPRERVVAMTLRDTGSGPEARQAGGYGPWINRVGIYHRLRRRWGQQYCPGCLASHPVIYRSWRYSSMVVCDRHQARLMDACPHCDAPVAVHRQLIALDLCHACSVPLTGAAPSAENWEPLFQAQSRHAQARSCGYGMVGGQAVNAGEFFAGARLLAMLVIERPQNAMCVSETARLPIEFLRVGERAQILLALEGLLSRWPVGFETLARSRRLTQRSFVRWRLPEWLAASVRRLPEGKRRGGHKRGLRERLRALQRLGAEGRSARAELLWRAAAR